LLVLTALAQAQGQAEAAAAHLHEAYALCQRLQIPVYLDRTRQLATACGISLAEE